MDKIFLRTFDLLVGPVMYLYNFWASVAITLVPCMILYDKLGQTSPEFCVFVQFVWVVFASLALTAYLVYEDRYLKENTCN